MPQCLLPLPPSACNFCLQRMFTIINVTITITINNNIHREQWVSLLPT
jgi:hypothetical protein